MNTAVAVQSTFVGNDANGTPVFIGSVVNHTEKGLTNGVVREGGSSYKDEPAVIVDYPDRFGHLNRLSRLVVAAQPAKTTSNIAEFPTPPLAETPAPSAPSTLAVAGQRFTLTISGDLLSQANGISISSDGTALSISIE